MPQRIRRPFLYVDTLLVGGVVHPAHFVDAAARRTVLAKLLYDGFLSVRKFPSDCRCALAQKQPGPIRTNGHKNTTVQNLHALNTLGGDLPVSRAVSFGVALFFSDCKALATAAVRFPFRRLRYCQGFNAKFEKMNKKVNSYLL